MPEPVFVIGATGPSGAALCRRLAETGRSFVPVVRDAAKWRALGLPGERRVVDLTEWRSLGDTLADARLVVACVHFRHVSAILGATVAAVRFVFLGNARRVGPRQEDGVPISVRAGEAAFMSSGRPGVMLHPTTIYGGSTADGIMRLAGLLRRTRLVPLPGGGRARIQPIHQDDVTNCLVAALGIDWRQPHSCIIAGAEPVSVAALVRAVAAAAGLPPPVIVPMPAGLVRAGLRIAGTVLRLPRVDAGDIALLQDDQSFPTAPMISLLGVTPIALTEGLARCFTRRV